MYPFEEYVEKTTMGCLLAPFQPVVFDICRSMSCEMQISYIIPSKISLYSREIVDLKELEKHQQYTKEEVTVIRGLIWIRDYDPGLRQSYLLQSKQQCTSKCMLMQGFFLCTFPASPNQYQSGILSQTNFLCQLDHFFR